MIFSAVKKKSNPARTSTAPDDLFVVNDDAEKLSKEGSTASHNHVAKTMYVSKVSVYKLKNHSA